MLVVDEHVEVREKILADDAAYLSVRRVRLS
jgi:hypothetical protein